MINITVTGDSLSDCQKQIIKMAEEIGDMYHSDVMPGPIPKFHEIDGIPHRGAAPTPSPASDTVQSVQVSQPVMAAPQATVTGTSDTDSSGLKWDARIHSSTKEITVKGVWRKRRGIDDDTVALVEAELRGNTPQAVPINIPPMPTSSVRVNMPDVNTSINNAAPTTTVISAPVMQQPQATNTHDINSFRANLVGILNGLANEGRITHDWIQQNKAVFNNKEIFQWHEEPVASQQLFDNFVTWGFIQEFRR